MGGDGDGLSIGAGHFPHAARRNIDMTYIMLDNNIYGMTKGQMSPTTHEDQATKTTPYGMLEEPMNPLKIALGYDVSFIARGFSGNVKQTVDLIMQAIRHPGFAFVQLLSPCVTFVGRDQFDIIRSMAVDLDDNYDPSSVENAWRIANEKGKISIGVIYRHDRPTFSQRMAHARALAHEKGDGDFDHLVNKYLVAA
ncbi:MAG: hypothetical protein D6814_14650 [Calditrichaeota bacterium]|nr:MAG: hypothetical protein D6814_14650 [Calditrichota bacterium]